LVALYLTLLPEDAGQRRYAVREVFNALRWRVRAGAPWSLLPHEVPTHPPRRAHAPRTAAPATRVRTRPGRGVAAGHPQARSSVPGVTKGVAGALKGAWIPRVRRWSGGV
jgi:hypothetical protein